MFHHPIPARPGGLTSNSGGALARPWEGIGLSGGCSVSSRASAPMHPVPSLQYRRGIVIADAAASKASAAAPRAEAEANYRTLFDPLNKGNNGVKRTLQKSDIVLDKGQRVIIPRKTKNISVVVPQKSYSGFDPIILGGRLSSGWMMWPLLLVCVSTVGWTAASGLLGFTAPPLLQGDVDIKDRTMKTLSEASSEMNNAQKLMAGNSAVKARRTMLAPGTRTTTVTSSDKTSAPPSSKATSASTSMSAVSASPSATAVADAPTPSEAKAPIIPAGSTKHTSVNNESTTISGYVSLGQGKGHGNGNGDDTGSRGNSSSGNSSRSSSPQGSSRAQSILNRVNDILGALDSAPPASSSPEALPFSPGMDLNTYNSRSGGRSPSSSPASPSPSSTLPPQTAAPISLPPRLPPPPQVADRPTQAAQFRLKQQMDAPLWAEREPAMPRKINGPASNASVQALKNGLLDVVYGTRRGVTATSEQHGAIEEFVTSLERSNPNDLATDALEVLDGRWKLIYTSNTQTLMMLNAIDSIPLVDIGDVYQVIDGQTLTAYNKIDVAVPMVLSLHAEAGFEVRTPRQFKVRFHKVGMDTFLETPQLLANIEIPESVTVLGNTIDLSPLRVFVVDPVNAGIDTANGVLRQATAPRFSIRPSDMTSVWMLTTYLDDTLRVSRDDHGRVFVMLRDVSIDELVGS